MDHSTWMKQIRVIDDHDRCEWLNVSSVTSSPRLSRTKSIELQNGCMCVCVCYTFGLNHPYAVCKGGPFLQM